VWANPAIRRHTLIPQFARSNALDWMELDLWKFGASSQILGCPQRLSLLVNGPLAGGSRLEEFLICKNRKCRFLVSLRADNKLLSRAELIFSACPECNHEWSGRCPFCIQPLDVTWQSEIPSCSHCRKPLKPDADVDNGTRRQ
jgi:hypothetical protein